MRKIIIALSFFLMIISSCKVQQKDQSDINKALYVLNGKISSKKEVDKIDPKKVLEINVLKGNAAKALYGKKGKRGVILIKTK